jgi:hypothetical protein
MWRTVLDDTIREGKPIEEEDKATIDKCESQLLLLISTTTYLTLLLVFLSRLCRSKAPREPPSSYDRSGLRAHSNPLILANAVYVTTTSTNLCPSFRRVTLELHICIDNIHHSYPHIHSADLPTDIHHALVARLAYIA